MTAHTAPAWYVGSTPWEKLTLAQRLYEAAASGPAHLSEAITLAGYQLGEPAERTAPAVTAILEFSYHNAESAELNAAVEWLIDRGYLVSRGLTAFNGEG
jgi:hypothetical protein